MSECVITKNETASWDGPIYYDHGIFQKQYHEAILMYPIGSYL